MMRKFQISSIVFQEEDAVAQNRFLHIRESVWTIHIHTQNYVHCLILRPRTANIFLSVDSDVRFEQCVLAGYCCPINQYNVLSTLLSTSNKFIFLIHITHHKFFLIYSNDEGCYIVLLSS